ncbi:MAG: hypothetical protein HQK79_23250, partial [Desulfobacterales bacterium]|nr:hypothetical protein [Desulfobacterales bacterium]
EYLLSHPVKAFFSFLFIKKLFAAKAMGFHFFSLTAKKSLLLGKSFPSWHFSSLCKATQVSKAATYAIVFPSLANAEFSGFARCNT